MNHNSSGTPVYPDLQFNVILLYSYTQKIYEELTQKNVTVDTIFKNGWLGNKRKEWKQISEWMTAKTMITRLIHFQRQSESIKVPFAFCVLRILTSENTSRSWSRLLTLQCKINESRRATSVADNHHPDDGSHPPRYLSQRIREVVWNSGHRIRLLCPKNIESDSHQSRKFSLVMCGWGGNFML